MSSLRRLDTIGSPKRQPLEIAREQETKSIELRAATSLARLLKSQGKRKKAQKLLATEGLETKELKGTKALLDELEA